MAPNQHSGCYCGNSRSFTDCCEPLLKGTEHAATAEALMRSRYCAFVVGDTEYLLASWHPDTRPSRVRINPDQKWLGLRIVQTEAGLAADTSGIVEFIARFKVGGGAAARLHERSRFTRIDHRWLYVDGDHL